MPTLDEFSLQKLIAGGETTTIVLRNGLPNLTDASQNLCALSNTRGGYFIAEISGAKEDSELFAVIEVILQAARQCFPTVLLEPSEPEIYHLGNKALVVATVPAMRWRKNGELHQTGGVFWTRRGSNSIPLRLNEIGVTDRPRSRDPG
jgi:hypothetical protein